ncbi:hypothetical protein MUK42_16478 [Musa troglodytarum]|uniref:Uncharacterized protein n=1 Tax=Musa troglodytarum TaxID=320322 RepID=A0A9E7L611_9LILI|nr:hypothetical protein MUK42_16478 [Musa troglodytarum]
MKKKFHLWNILITEYCESGFLIEGRPLFDEMPRREHTANAALEAETKLGNKARLGNLLENNQADEPEFRDKKNKVYASQMVLSKSRYDSSYFMEGQVLMGKNCIICEVPQIDLANHPCSNKKPMKG